MTYLQLYENLLEPGTAAWLDTVGWEDRFSTKSFAASFVILKLYLCICVFVFVYHTHAVYLCGEPVVRGILALSRLTLGTCQHQTPLVLTILVSVILTIIIISINSIIIPIILATIVIFRDDG